MPDKREQLTNLMEKNFNKAFDMLGTATNMKDIHKVYDLLFESKQIYMYLKEEK